MYVEKLMLIISQELGSEFKYKPDVRAIRKTAEKILEHRSEDARDKIFKYLMKTFNNCECECCRKEYLKHTDNIIKIGGIYDKHKS